MEGIIGDVYDPKIEQAKKSYQVICGLPIQYRISKGLLPDIERDQINRKYINDLAQIARSIENTRFVESDKYNAQAAKNSSIGYIETVIICSIDEEYNEFVKGHYKGHNMNKNKLIWIAIGIIILALITGGILTKQRADILQMRDSYVAKITQSYIKIYKPLLSFNTYEQAEDFYNSEELIELVDEFIGCWKEYEYFCASEQINPGYQEKTEKLLLDVKQFQSFEKYLTTIDLDKEYWQDVLYQSQDQVERYITRWENNLEAIEGRLSTPWRSYFFKAWRIVLS